MLMQLLCGPLPTLNNMHWLWALAAVATAATPVSGSSDRDGGGVRVIGAGLGRTGSDSLREALTILGFKTYHMLENFKAGDGHIGYWREAARGDPNGADRVIDNVFLANGYNATTDFPACILYRELLARNPDARVILSVRSSPQVWRASVEHTIGRLGHIANLPPLKYVLPSGFEELDPWIWGSIGVKREPNGTLVGLEEGYTNWINSVKENVPPEKLLIHTSPDGWGPICKFLDIKNCPTIPYPRRNSGAEMGTVVDFAEFMVKTWPIPLIAGLLVAVAIVKFIYQRCCRSSDKVKKT